MKISNKKLQEYYKINKRQLANVLLLFHTMKVNTKYETPLGEIEKPKDNIIRFNLSEFQINKLVKEWLDH